ncbi:1-aminocyclopropane-1-carboxylate deaminase/D-cysteine desulfhydrase [Salinimicrobium sp. GXAS 041]|uniref:1-aminocyclopropane-1-carboxylate deaminase/D-cysteine desulfhydrase n=1 Tax=Salinimicrobium sp. GXAS 041 TaxID=3400806 RepID=UPI003C782063
MLQQERSIPNQFITEKNGVSLFLKREDLLHPEVSGNKFRKLKYNLQNAIFEKYSKIVTFGGAYSNHIAATAAAGKLYGLKTIGIIRGEELGRDIEKTIHENATLKFASSCGMEFDFISREDYRLKDSDEMLERLQKKFGLFYLIPEGGTNDLAIKGCEEILSDEDKKFHVVCCPVGTCGTISGIVNSSFEAQKIIGFPALKGDFLASEVEKFTCKKNWELAIDYHFGGYAKVNEDLVNFINNFKMQYNVRLDPVYTGKMMYGVLDLISKGHFSENTRILAVHTGGLQGIPGMNRLLKKKGLPQIDI